MGNAEKLEVFTKAHSLTLDLYNITNCFPKEEKFSLIDQIRRAAVSVNSNLLEGSHRTTDGEYRHFVSIARGSTGELKYQLLVAKDLNYLSQEKYLDLKRKLDEISRMLAGLINALTS